MKKVLLSNRLVKSVILVIALVVLAAGVAAASDAITVAYGTNQSITAFSNCKVVTNSSPTGLSVYVPNTTAAEWSSFYASPPAGVSATACVTGTWTITGSSCRPGPIAGMGACPSAGWPACSTLGLQCQVVTPPGSPCASSYLVRVYTCQ